MPRLEYYTVIKAINAIPLQKVHVRKNIIVRIIIPSTLNILLLC